MNRFLSWHALTLSSATMAKKKQKFSNHELANEHKKNKHCDHQRNFAKNTMTHTPNSKVTVTLCHIFIHAKCRTSLNLM